MRQVLAMPDVYFVTYSQLLDWMERPVNKNQMATWQQCNPWTLLHRVRRRGGMGGACNCCVVCARGGATGQEGS